MKLAPIALFVYNRPDHTRQTLEALKKNGLAGESELYIYSDGPKTPGDEEMVEKVRGYVWNIKGFKKVSVIEKKNNNGLANSIITGVTEIVNQHGRIIVLEDDLITSPYFLEYINTSLNLYEKDNKVVQISGYMFPIQLKIQNDALFFPFTSSWGWATWSRAWKQLDPSMAGYSILKHDKKMRYKFNINGSYPYFEMLNSQLNNKIDSWAIRWYLSTFISDSLTLFPAKTLINNIGFDNSGTHCSFKLYQDNIEMLAIRPTNFPKHIAARKKDIEKVAKFLKSYSLNYSPFKRNWNIKLKTLLTWTVRLLK
jgi:hypothetical protein